MSKITYTLYSKEKKKIVLTFCRAAVKERFYDDDSCVRFISVINGKGEYSVDGETEKCVSGDSMIFEKGRSFTLLPESDMEIFTMKFSLSDFI